MLLQSMSRIPPGEPTRVLPDEATWGEMAETLAAAGFALVYARVSDWIDGELDPGRAGRLLGPEAARYLEIGDARSRARFAASRAVLRRAASTVAGGDPEQFEIARQPNGRPYLRGCDQFDVSISHTGAIVVAGVSRLGSIGVDVESASRRVLGPELAERACTDEERARLAALPPAERDRAMIQLWTLKEAYSKALGVGLRLPFRTFGFEIEPDGLSARLIRSAAEDCANEEWVLQIHDVEGRYAVGLAVSASAFDGTRDLLGDTMLDAGLTGAVLANLEG
jgi:4'-phosphopantetheinyl transferase